MWQSELLGSLDLASPPSMLAISEDQLVPYTLSVRMCVREKVSSQAMK